MSAPEAGLYQSLTSDPDVSKLVGTRVYPMILPENPNLPAITYQLISDVPQHTQEGFSHSDCILRVNCWGKTYDDAVSLSGAVASRLDSREIPGYDRLLLAGRQDLQDAQTGLFRRLMEFRAWTGALA